MPTEEQKLAKKEYNKNYYQKNKKTIIERAVDYYINNKENVLVKSKNYRLEHTESLKAYKKSFYEKNKESISKTNKQYSIENKEKIKSYQQEYRERNKEKRNTKERERNQNDPLYKLSNNIRRSIRDSFKRNGYTKKSKTYEILGCTFEEFKQHIESLFEPWMNWNNHGLYNGQLNYGWDIDHKIPSSSALNEEEVIRLNHYTNLQPLCSHYNRDIKKASN